MQSAKGHDHDDAKFRVDVARAAFIIEIVVAIIKATMMFCRKKSARQVNALVGLSGRHLRRFANHGHEDRTFSRNSVSPRSSFLALPATCAACLIKAIKVTKLFLLKTHLEPFNFKALHGREFNGMLTTFVNDDDDDFEAAPARISDDQL